MPVTTEKPVEALAHCVDAHCKGNVQVKVDGVLEERHWSYVELGGDAPGFERSQTHLRFADESQHACPHCGGPRDLTDQKRPRYEPRVGNPNYLLELHKLGLIAAPGEQQTQAEQKSEIAELKAQLAALTELVAQKANKPGPKPKQED